MSNLSNTINYIELPATDLERTKKFYGEVFGWTFVDYGPEYVSFEGAGVDGGFTLGSTPAEQGGVLVVLYHEDLEQTAEKIRSCGCEVVRSIFAFPGGRRFHFRDPNGNELAVWSE